MIRNLALFTLLLSVPLSVLFGQTEYLPKKLYEEDGEMTPTMKVERKYVNEAVGDLIEAMYGRKQG